MTARVRPRRAAWVPLAFLLTGAACSDDGVAPADFYPRFYGALCDKAWMCLTLDEREGAGSVYGPSLDECKARAAEALAAPCPGGQTFNGKTAQRCLDELTGASCGQLRFGSSFLPPAACNTVCDGPSSAAPRDAGEGG